MVIAGLMGSACDEPSEAVEEPRVPGDPYGFFIDDAYSQDVTYRCETLGSDTVYNFRLGPEGEAESWVGRYDVEQRSTGTWSWVETDNEQAMQVEIALDDGTTWTSWKWLSALGMMVEFSPRTPGVTSTTCSARAYEGADGVDATFACVGEGLTLIELRPDGGFVLQSGPTELGGVYAIEDEHVFYWLAGNRSVLIAELGRQVLNLGNGYACNWQG